MVSFLKRLIDPELEVVEAAYCFSNGLSTTVSFVNGWFCSVCDRVTEHVEKDGYRICGGCGLTKAYLVATKVLSAELKHDFLAEKREQHHFQFGIYRYSKQMILDEL